MASTETFLTVGPEKRRRNMFQSNSQESAQEERLVNRTVSKYWHAGHVRGHRIRIEQGCIFVSMSHSEFINSLAVTTALRKTVLRFSFESVQG